MQFLWTYVIGPVLALLPMRWRRALGSGDVVWKRAGLLSGLLEGFAGIVGLGYWYMYEMGKLVNAGVESAANGSLGAGVTEAQIAAVSLIVFASQPLTWVLGYLVLEGAVRMCGAAFAGNAFGTLPLGIVDWAFGIFRKSEESPGEVAKRSVASFADGVKERLMEARSGNLPDELCYRKEGEEEILEIRASKKKAEWQAPKVVRVDDFYYRLEESGVRGGARPFWYRLRRLAAGVPGRTVILYRTTDAVVRE
jgi:hypothetical protein